MTLVRIAARISSPWMEKWCLWAWGCGWNTARLWALVRNTGQPQAPGEASAHSHK